MSGRRSLVLLAALLQPSCHRTTALPAPTLDGIRSVLVVESTGTEVIGAYALDIPDRGVPPWPVFGHKGGTEIHLLEYGCTLDRMNLKPGVQAFKTNAPSTPLLPKAASMERIATDAATSGWAPEPDPPDWLAGALGNLDGLPPTTPCDSTAATFAPTALTLPDDRHGPPRMGVALDDTSALIAAAGIADLAIRTRYYHVDVSGAVDEVSIDAPGVKTVGWVGGFRAAGGELYLISREGTLVRGTYGRPFTVVTSTTMFTRTSTVIEHGTANFADHVALTGPTTADVPFELFAESYDPRVFARFDGTSWHKLAEQKNGGSLFIPAVAWLGPGHAVAIGIGHTDASVARYRGGEVTYEPLPGASGPAAILQHPTVGTIVGRDNDGIDVNAGMGWSELRTTDRVLFVRVLTPLGDGFMYGASTMYNFGGFAFAQWYPSSGACPLVVYTDVATIGLVSLGSDTLVAATLSDFEAPLGLTLLKKQHPEHECSQRTGGSPR